MTESDPKKPKIIVDEDWKSQVQSEKEAAAKASENKDQAAPDTDADPSSMPIPEASFSLLATTLASQALAAMGQMSAPGTEKVEVNLDMAKHCIDTLGMLEEKTKGNLDADETQLLTGFLHELRMAFVMVQNQAQSGGVQK